MSLSMSLILVSESGNCQAVALEHDGKAGVWLPEDMARGVLADSKELDATKKLVEDLKAQKVLKDERILVVKEALAASEEAEKRAIMNLDTALQAKQAAEEKLNKWYRKPVFLITVGIVLTIGLEVGAVKVIQASSD